MIHWPRLRPTPACAGLLLVLLAMWYAASSQNNAAGYLLFFALGSVLLISIPHSVLNVGGLTAKAQAPKPTFVGDEVSLPVEIINKSGSVRRAICMDLPTSDCDEERVDEIRAGGAARASLRFPAISRGEHEIEGLRLTTTYPLGLVRAITLVACRQRYLVYPKPAGNPKLPFDRGVSCHSQTLVAVREGDDFSGLRAYLPGESQRHIDWKAVARGQPLMTKQYTTEVSGVLYLDFASVSSGDTEARLAQLALWIIEAERARIPYGLRIAAVEIRPSVGQAHFHQCLRALALYK